VLLCITLPIASFYATLYAPTIAHAIQGTLHLRSTQPAPRIAQAAASAPSTPAPVDDSPDLVGELPDGSANIPNTNQPLTVQTFQADRVPMTLVIGGTPASRLSPVRQGVTDFVRQAGATAGLNGTFFANASLNGTDNLLIGPSMSDDQPHLLTSPYDNKPQLNGRPMVLMSPKRTVIVPYQVGVTNDEDTIRGYLPNVKSAFLGGVWLVHGGQSAGRDGVMSFGVKDAMDPRRRAFFGVMPDGRPVLGATTYVATSADLSEALQQFGIQEAVLLDSGFSTSLVFQDKILVTGHTAPGVPSRPVPEALVLYGNPDPASVKLAEGMTESVARGFAPDVSAAKHRRHRAAPAGAAPGAASPSAPAPSGPPLSPFA
jgi:hypothetical protein